MKTAKKKTWYTVGKKRSIGANSSITDVMIYDEIGEYGVTAREFVNSIKRLDAINLRINSPGGSVADGLAIYNAIRRHNGRVDAYIDGVALSMGSVVAMAAEQVHAAETALLMVHNPWTAAVGDAKEFRKEAEVLDKHASALVKAYSKKTGLSDDDIKSLMDDETWMDAEEAQQWGFVDGIYEGDKVAACVSKEIAARYTKAPANRIEAENTHIGYDSAKETTTGSCNPGFEPTETTENTQQSANSGDNTGGHKMPGQKDVGVKADDIKNAAQEATQAERVRVNGVKAAFKDVEGDFSGLIDKAIDDGDTVAEVQKRVEYLKSAGKGSQPISKDSSISAGLDESEKFRSGVSNAIMSRSGLAKRDAGNEYNGMTMLELARASVRKSGQAMPGNKMAVVAAAFTHSTSDFTSILADVANRSMLRGFEEAEESFEAWTVKGSLSDFKQMSRVGTTALAALREVKEGGEFKSTTMGDYGETIQLATYGELFSITRQSIIDDNTQSFAAIPRKFGRAARRTVGDIAYSALTTNAAMSDTVDLFHADHNNLGASGTVITTDSVDAVRKAMMLQKGRDTAVTALNIRPKYLLCPVAISGQALTVQTSQTPITATANKQIMGVNNIVANTFETITDARLDADDANDWYMIADPAQHDTIEVAYLDGNESPFLDQQNGWNVDGTEFKVRIDAAAAPMEYATMYKQAGA